MKRPANKHRKSFALRTSFGPSQFEDDNDSTSDVVIPKRTNLSRIAIQRNADKRPAPDFVFRQTTPHSSHNRPSYSKDYLDELKQSTPSTPKDTSFRSSPDTNTDSGRDLDLATNFSSNPSTYQLPTLIPSDAEIAEKKARRARLAKEREIISLDDDGDEHEDDEDEHDDNTTHDELGRLILKPKDKYPETRLVRDDEDMLEGFDEFTTDGRIDFGNAAERLASAKRKAEMATLIADAEGHDEVSSDDESEAERKAAFEVTQTRHGNYAVQDRDDENSLRPQTPPRILPISSLESVVERLRSKLQEMEVTRMAKMQEMQRLVAEKSSIGEEEVRVQAALKETGEKYARLREDILPRTRESEPDADNQPSDLDPGNQLDEIDTVSGLGKGREESRSVFAGLGAQ